MIARSVFATAAIVMCCTMTMADDELLTMETCAMCHEDEAAAFAASPHGRAMAQLDASILDRSCAQCHGATAEHIDDPSPENVRRAPESSACVSCHPASRPTLAVSNPAHTRFGVACADCHSAGHTDLGTDHLLADEPFELCATCHQSVAGEFKMPFAHRDGTRNFDCTNCHSMHGQNQQGRLNLLSKSGACVDCHTEKTGPFVFPHPPRELDGCIACHHPHGSTNPRQLRRRSVAQLCIECHAGVPAFHNLSQTRYQACQNCHVAVHGSNRDPRLLEE
jgi:DmsE family decaheme c-type cytochrome